MDQLAALSWVQENAAVFKGDPNKVTLVGHSTGAACIGYLLASPVLVPGRLMEIHSCHLIYLAWNNFSQSSFNKANE